MDGEHTARGVDLLTLPADRFLNVIYRAMIDRLPVDEAGQRPDRAALDNALGVSGWPTPGGGRYPIPEREPGAPAWWQGDEEASQGWLRAAGVTVT